ncbi:phenylalanine--tRNA ligase subunit beta [Lichenihabitans psoromatis]|uniref:phenylalanine--tRNA ligase subunit beta n=1 Tax=Lichenihabitans psoromatis TaxID=2528642 RepID=UPI001036C852|nr:phenylalanine--tRNA ligase subunit beta [Lichenihabitans psoromatis]
MKFTLSWLKDHLDTTASLDTIVDKLTQIGLEVEGVDDPSAQLSGFVIARVIEAVQHPNADRLRVCSVDTGSGTPVQVVCGAPNARTGMLSVFSPPGTFIPGKGITLGSGVIRGVESNGMLCSGSELGLSDDHDGILDLPADASVGQPYATWAKLDDPVIDINLTPNRPDAASIHGIARDLAAAGLGTMTTVPVAPVEGAFPCPATVSLDLSDGDAHLAPAFALRLVRGVKNGPSPEWMQRRLRAIGLRPISALVDVTNYITFDRGRPLHVFDANKVQGTLRVRRAEAGETIVGLDGKTHALDATMVVIADDRGPESIAGIMGGEASGCDEHTTDVLIESALWDAGNIAQTGRKLGINTDARYRFERGVDPAFCVSGAEWATTLVMQLCGGMPSDLVLVGRVPDPDLRIDFPWSEVKRLTGLDLPQATMRDSLERLGFAVEQTSETTASVRVPTWRPDVAGEADLVEEVLRLAGLDHVVPVPLPRLVDGVPKPVLTLLQRRTRLAKRTLASCGLLEAVTWSFVSKQRATFFGGGSAALALANPIAADLSDMRPSLLPGLIAAAQRNADRGIGDVALFEVGQIFLSDGETDQRFAAAAVRRGTAKIGGAGRHWAAANTPVDVYDAKADALALLASLAIPAASIQVVPGGPAWLHPGRSGTLQLGPKTVIGSFGELHPAVLEAMGCAGPVAVFEIVLDALPPPKAKPTKARGKLDLPDLMPVERDFAFLAGEAVAASDILKAVQGADRASIVDASVFDVYRGAGVPEGRKSVAIAVTLQPRDRTMTEQDLEAISLKIEADVLKKTGASLRR